MRWIPSDVTLTPWKQPRRLAKTLGEEMSGVDFGFEALAEELLETGIKLTCLAPGATATGFGADSGMEKSIIFKLGEMDAGTVAQMGYRGFRRSKVLVIPGLKNKLGVLYAVRLAPRIGIRKLVKRLLGKRAVRSRT